MKQYKITNRSEKPQRVPGSSSILVPAGGAIMVTAKEFSLSLLKLNKLFTLEEIVVAKPTTESIDFNESKARKGTKARAGVEAKPAESSRSTKKKVSEDG